MILPEKHISESLCMESKSWSCVNFRKLACGGSQKKIGSGDLRIRGICGRALEPEEVGSP